MSGGGVFKATHADTEADKRSEISIPDETTEENYNLYVVQGKQNNTKRDNATNTYDTFKATTKESKRSGSVTTLNSISASSRKNSKTLTGIRIRKSRDSVKLSATNNPYNQRDDEHDSSREPENFKSSNSTINSQYGKGLVTDLNAKTRTPQKENREEASLDKGDTSIKHKKIRHTTVAKGHIRRPVYDTMNTSTSMIMLNNKHGKRSRLWTSDGKEDHTPRQQLIDPDRHARENTMYLSGGFHTRCTTSERPVRFSSTFKLNLDFNDRPQSDRIGDRLYEARLSVNPHRHRRCTTSSSKPTEPFDISSQKINPKYYMFPWERTYSQPLTRPLTSYTSQSMHHITRAPWGASHFDIKTVL